MSRTLLPDSGNPFYGPISGFSLSLSKGAHWNVTGDSFVNRVHSTDGIINLGDGAKKIIVDNVYGTSLTVNTESLDHTMTIKKKSDETDLTVHGTGGMADDIQKDHTVAQKLADITRNEKGISVANHVTTAEGVLAGSYKLEVVDGKVQMPQPPKEKDASDKEDINPKGDTDASKPDDAVKPKDGTDSGKTDESGADSSKHNATDGKVKLTYTPNKTNVAIASLAAMNLMTWRQENNDMYKRLGELRDSKGQQGLWVRMVRGQIKYGVRSMKNQYSYYQVGWDTKVGSNWTVGAAYSKTDGTTSFYRGTADNDHDGAAIYGSYLADDGSFIDLIAKYTHIDTDYETFHGAGSASYDNDAFSVSAEYGKRFHGKGGLWIEPQAELTYGRVSAADFLTKNGVKVYSDSAGSLVGRLGMVLGRDIKAGHLYAKASYLYDFDGDTITNMTYKGAKERFSDDIGGGWWEVGIGANLNLNKATYLYIDAEKTCGGNVAAPWQWSLGVRYSF